MKAWSSTGLPFCNLYSKQSTWFFPFSIKRFVTLPKGNPKEITSASVTSLGSFRIWITRDGTPALLLSPLNFLLSFPLAEKRLDGHGLKSLSQSYPNGPSASGYTSHITKYTEVHTLLHCVAPQVPVCEDGRINMYISIMFGIRAGEEVGFDNTPFSQLISGYHLQTHWYLISLLWLGSILPITPAKHIS